MWVKISSQGGTQGGVKKTCKKKKFLHRNTMKVNILCLVKYFVVIRIAIKKSLHLIRSFVNIILHFYRYITLSFVR